MYFFGQKKAGDQFLGYLLLSSADKLLIIIAKKTWMSEPSNPGNIMYQYPVRLIPGPAIHAINAMAPPGGCSELVKNWSVIAH